jgi:hypothetical protein
MRNTKNILIYSLLALSIAGCSKKLDETNKNPNATENAQPDYLLTAAIKTSVDAYWGTTNNMNSSLLFIQHWAKIQYTEEDRYVFSNSSFASLWSTLYSTSINNLNELSKLGLQQDNKNYQGVALTLRSWAFLLLTDAYGDIPYSQAGNIKAYVTPVYDRQQDVYNGLLADLATAQSLLDPAGKTIAGDVIYSGDITRWKKFANALRLRIALRIADRDADKARIVVNEVKSQPDLFFSGTGDIAKLTYLSSPNQNPVNALFETRDDYRVSKSIIDKLFDLKDPRLVIYANKTQTTTPQEYIGVPNGLTNSDASNLGFAKTSKPGAYFQAAQAPAVIFSEAEFLFDLAEAAARGYTADGAADLYAQAIIASFKQYGLTNEAATAYLAQTKVAYDATDFRKSIGEQKWIALFGQGLEAFAEWRRLDYPVLPAAVAGVLNGDIPKRFIYPGTEQSLNGDNYKAAVSNQGADLLTTKLWFDVK